MKILKTVATVLSAGTLVAGLGVAANAAAPFSPAAGKVKIVRISMDAVGADTASNTWREYIDIKNVSGTAVNVEGWATFDAWSNNNDDNPKGCNTITFRKANSVTDAGGFQHLKVDNPDTKEVETEGLWLPKGHTIRVYTGGAVDSTDNNLHTVAINKSNCGYNGHYLNNNADKVYLKDADGKLVDSKGYNWQGANFLSFS